MHNSIWEFISGHFFVGTENRFEFHRNEMQRNKFHQNEFHCNEFHRNEGINENFARSRDADVEHQWTNLIYSGLIFHLNFF